MLLTISSSLSARLFTEEVCEHLTKSILIPSSKRVPERVESLSNFTFFIHGKIDQNCLNDVTLLRKGPSVSA